GRVDGRLNEPDMCTELLVGHRYKPGPQRGHRAGSPYYSGRAVHANGVTRDWIGVPGHVRHAAAARARARLRDVRVRLPGWQSKYVTHTAAGRALLVGQLVPNHLGDDIRSVGIELGSPASHHVRTRRRKVDVIAGTSVRRTVIAGGNSNCDSQGRGRLAS